MRPLLFHGVSMRKSILALIGFIVLIAIAIGIRFVLPVADTTEGSAVKAVQAPDADSGMPRSDSVHTETNITVEKEHPAGAKPQRETADIKNSAIPAPSSSDGSSFSRNEASRLSDAEVKRYIELRKETLAMQKGPAALEHYYELKQEREQKTLAREEYRKLRQEYDQQRREWKLVLAEAVERARITGDNSQVDELVKLEPVRPKRKLKQPAEAKNE